MNREICRKIDRKISEGTDTVVFRINSYKFHTSHNIHLIDINKMNQTLRDTIREENLMILNRFSKAMLKWFSEQINWLEKNNIRYNFNVINHYKVDGKDDIVKFIVKFYDNNDALWYKVTFAGEN